MRILTLDLIFKHSRNDFKLTINSVPLYDQEFTTKLNVSSLMLAKLQISIEARNMFLDFYEKNTDGLVISS